MKLKHLLLEKLLFFLKITGFFHLSFGITVSVRMLIDELIGLNETNRHLNRIKNFKRCNYNRYFLNNY